MDYTLHSIARKTQRGIKTIYLGLLLEYGSERDAPGGVKKIILERRDIQEAIAKRKREIQELSRLSGLTAITDGSNILTVYKAH